MSKVIGNLSRRLLVALLSVIMVFSMMPFAASTAFAATTEHPNAVTITVVDENGSSVEGAEVQFVIDSEENGNNYLSGSGILTDENGCAEIMSSEDFVAEDLTISATVSKTDYTEGSISNESITSADQNFVIAITSTIIKDVTVISNSGQVYNGEPQPLVTISGTQNGDIVKYMIDDTEELQYKVGEDEELQAKKTNAGTYKVEVTVAREGYTDLVKTFEAITIAKATKTGYDIEAKSNLTFDEEKIDGQELVTLTGDLRASEIVSAVWSVDGENEEGLNIPKRAAINKTGYSVKLVIDFGNNFEKFEKTVTAKILDGEIKLDGLSVKGLESVYKVEDGEPVAQPAVSVENQGNYALKYQLDDGDLSVSDSAWVDTIPTVTDAGSYIVWVKAVKENYSDADVNVEPAASAVAPYNVHIAKAEQSFSFNNFTGTSGTDTLSGEVPYGKTYDFAATDPAALADGTITYSVELDEDGIASIDENTGSLTVDYPGSIKVIATLSGNKNYKDCIIEYTLEVSGVVASDGQYIKFANNQIDYVLGTSDTVATQTATKNNNKIKGSISYALDKAPGVEINSNTGVVSVKDYNALADATRKATDGSLKLTVTATKGKSGKYGADKDTYIINISFENTPDSPYTLPVVDGLDNWYISDVDVTPTEGYKIAKAAVDTFAEKVTFNDQGTNTRYVYLKNTTTGGITDRIAVDIKIDTANPTNLDIQFHNTKEEHFIKKVGELLGFYNPSVTITFSAEDATSGLDHFDWTYTPEEGEPITKPIEVKSDGTAELTLPADQAEQLHGKISFTATDKAGNTIGETDSGYVFIVDTIAPELSVKYLGQAPYEAQTDIYNNAHFFNSDVEVELTVTETNFYAEDVIVKVSKDGATPTAVTPSWNNKVGTFTLAGDGDYVVYVTYTDKANNKMTDYASEIITIDKTAPVVKLEYVHNNDVQKTIFTVTEHNFRANDVTITGTMKDIKGVDVAFTAARLTEILRVATWTQNGDTYTTEYDAYVTGIYNLNMDYKDIAGWNAEQSTKGFTIDHDAPTDIKIEYAKSPIDTFLEVITLGFYNPSVTVRFTAYDTSSGVETFTWGYTKQTGASTIKHPENLPDETIDAVQDQDDKSKFTAEITLTADEAAQYRGYISALATDTFGNKSDKKTDDGNIIVVDTIAPEITVEYTKADREIEISKDSSDYFYNNAVVVKLTVTEANFYAEDINVTVTKNGKAFDFGTVNWGSRNAEDKTIGTFTIPAPDDHSGDGHYVITVEYKDRSNNEMVKYVSDTHTIDTIAPVINVKYDNDKVAVVNELTDRDGNTRKYYADTKTATVTITEHNFIADEVDFTIIAKDVTGAELDATKLNNKSDWSVDSTGDVHTITITYPGDANYSFDVAYTDKATNDAEDYKTDFFTVDKTDPTNLKVSYSTSVLDTILESVTFGFYNAKMTVTLTAEDSISEVHSFLYSYLNASGVSDVNAQLINEAIQAADIKYSEDRKTATGTFEIPKMVLDNDNQFNGTVEFTATDRAGNETDSHKETKRIVVDNIAPNATIAYNAPVNEVNGISYYDGNITGTVTITEANFYSDDVVVMVEKDGAAQQLPTTWTDSSVDVHIGTFTLTEDADYVVSISYKDKSGNAMNDYKSNQLTIDTKIEEPTYSINGKAQSGDNGGAYKNDASITFSFEDQNYDTNTVKLTRTRFNKVEDVTNDFIKISLNDKGGSGTFTIPNKVNNDGIYLLTVSMTDKAKHSTESHVKFTVNRFGSVYEYSDYLCNLIKDGGQYIKLDASAKAAITKDLVITEYNADRLVADSLKILITRDGEPVDVIYTSNPEKINENVTIGSDGWYKYVYTISKGNFKEDGVYKITISSKDATGNESTSVPDNSINNDGKKILDTMTFTVDTTAPEIRNIINLDKEIASKDAIVDGKLNVKYTLVDVGGLAKVEVYLNGEVIDTITKFDNNNNFTGAFDISESNDIQTVRLVVTDLAGNVTDTESDKFNPGELYTFNNAVTVSTNFFVRWYRNTPLFWGSIGGVVVIAGGIWFLIAAKRKKKEA